MDTGGHHALVGQALTVLARGLSPFVNHVLAKAVPPGTEWPELLRRKDAANGRGGGEYRSTDLAMMLRAMTERLGDVGYPFSRSMPRQAEIYAKELREVRNKWAHTGEFTAPEAYRAIDSAELLLRSIDAPEPAAALAQLKAAVSPLSTGTPTNSETPVTTTTATKTAPRVPTPPRPPQPGAPRIDIAAIPDLSYAMAHCRIPVIDHITIDNTLGDLLGATIEIDVVSAEGSHGGPREVHADLSPGRPTTLRDVDLKLDPASMLTVDEQRPADIRVVVRDPAGAALAEAAHPVNVLAANQWKASPTQLALEMLAAYVQPNSTAVAALMPKVSDRLLETTGNSAIDGYQSENPDRVDAIARAVFEAMRACDIRYAEPPASWGDDGQKVRTPAEVLEGRLGTCLDTTLTMAAVLEQAGINTTIWVLRGHAFLGYWRTDSALSTVSTTEAVEVANQVDLGAIGLIETTMVTQSADGATFDDARAVPRIKYLSDGLGDVIGITDICQARQARIYPLPSRAVDDQGNVVVTEYKPANGPVIMPYVATETKAAAPQGAVPARVTQWKNALLDLSLRNRLINFTDRAGFRIEIPGPALARFEDAINAGDKITLMASDAVKSVDQARGIRFGRDLPEQERELLLADKHSAYIDITDASYQRGLRNLAYKARTIREETGANNLYLAFGMLSWHLNDRELRSPLILVPVSLSTSNRGQSYVLTIDDAGASTPNYCLVEKLRTALGLEIPGLANPDEDASGIDLAGTFNSVRRAIADAGLAFRVEDTVHLSILQFAKFPLWKDLDESWEALSRNPLVKHLIETPTSQFVDPVGPPEDVDLDELGASVPVPADSSQLRAVAEAVGGRTFVLEGPPGTGKSQTITNLLAHAMAAGRRVLFVAEKRAALDVVKKRLESVGLGELSLDLHDKSARPAAVRAQIKEALELRVTHDADLLRTKLQSAESSRRSLARYAERLHEMNAVGHSLYTARSRELAADPDVEPFEVPKSLVASADPSILDAVDEVMRGLPEKVDLARPRREHAWGFIDSVPATGLDAAEVYTAAVEFDAALEDVLEGGLALDQLAKAHSPNAVDAWARLAAEPRFPLDAVDSLHEAKGKNQLNGIDQLSAKIAATQPDWLATATPAAMDLDIPAIHKSAVEADESGFFGRKKRRRAVREQLADVLAVDPSTVKLKTLSALTADIEATYRDVSDLRGRVAKLPTQLIDPSWNPLVSDDATRLADALAAVRRVGKVLSEHPDEPRISAMRAFYRDTGRGALAQPLQRLASAWQRLTAVTGTSENQQRMWAGEGSFLEQWRATRGDRKLQTPASAERWVDLVTHVEPLRKAGMDHVRVDILKGMVVPEDAPSAFDHGAARASVTERLEASALGDFDVTAHTKTIQRFTSSASAIREELRRAIPAELLGSRTFDAAADTGQVGGLRRQLDRKRGGMSVRALMDNFGELITQILPCTLMSPDSVARFFPARPDIFDIVVFDEASQIRVADAIGAMGRAKSVVVVGDSKQMPPTSFAEASATVDDDEDYNPDVVADEESILTECVHAQVPQQWLSWHYRSQDEALIAFSNMHYYGGQLASFPAPHAGTAGHGISLVRVDGHFERSGKGKTLRTNRVEAERIVEDIRRRFAESPAKAPSLGVITFNAQQRDLIENMLRDTRDERLLAALDEPDGLFVKNLENVQGDERDTILFSVAFSKKENGVLPLNFGPLSRPGGERRLNVAVTRARREVVLYASFDPADLRAEETTQVGTKHLKAYLELAARGVDTIIDGGKRQPVIDRHRDDIAEALRNEGFVVRTDVGLSEFRVDLVIADPDQPDRALVAVLLDGAEWYRRKTVADRDGLPIDVLSNLMHWPSVERVWMPEWLNYREATLERLRQAVDDAKQRLAQPVEKPSEPVEIPTLVIPPPVSGPKHESATIGSLKSAPTVTAPKPKQHPNIRTFREWSPRIAGDKSVLDALPSPWAKSQVLTVAREIIEAEAPIHRDRLVKLVAGAFGLGRVNDDRRRSIQRVVPTEYRRDRDDFYWAAGVNPDEWSLVRQPEAGGSRPLDEVSLIEIGNAMSIVAEQTGGIEREELKREALALFGGRRVTQAIGARLDDALKLAVDRGVLRVSPSGLVLVA
ncbi:DUF3320 domain-containing protein [Mycolicibacterium smegmatis]|uniref:DNA helicase n=1 Tax=Mycolicibacterium smegmatis (strain MKD8) TaxID=1214915 RepID=A0A2U9PKN2_MYCSE|nr:DUF3320 domain-containing protein [Mycolicibacterium smegmatis]AWT52246.1 hypothetical protein D806_012580 [Mycolicibacterium smegmatis MKD8]